MTRQRKLGWKSDLRKANLRNLTTNLLYHGRIKTTLHRAKEVRGIAERLITIAKKETDNYTEVEAQVKVPKRDSDGKRVKDTFNGKTIQVYETVTKTIRKDSPSRLNARRKIISALYPVTSVPADGRKKKSLSEPVDMPRKMFDEIGPKYAERPGGYTRIIRIGQRKGDGAEMVYLELV